MSRKPYEGPYREVLFLIVSQHSVRTDYKSKEDLRFRPKFLQVTKDYISYVVTK